ncbi:MAG: ABC transporter substrate-binding protein [Mesorhizobium sp.]|uniref:ABC transporter substrate-binding protein n=1 Tax=Mesorhizobium sp. TaxID=1871066 RepID=UPI0012090E0D|nr:ABC transporter substrate-binding protein [Mesorhizobium sp.]TIU72152.1 MAG: ABC transporter substrate-binding protein [Mesorhizobium sp.]TIW14091.1 MAG: ABC transporter substrate-binding protein [Mesorhizobium sp.]TIW70608.1 MAG: ABC transporter substrate-binding protein [Mesorhizobium sp.]
MSRVSKTAGCAIALILAVGVAHASEVTPPADIAKAGKITYCAEFGNPPLGFYDENQVLGGLDVDIGTEIGKRMGVKVEWKETAFSAIIPALLAKQCDAILSQLFDKPQRREVVDFTNYMYSSQSLLVPKGNPKNVKGLEDLSGLKAAVDNGTTIQSLLEEQNKKFKEAGKPEVTVTVFPKDSDARQALQIGQVDVYGTTLETAAFFLQKAGHIFDIGGEPFAKIKTGIATRKGETEMHDAVQKAFESMKADGTYKKLLAKWGLEGDAIE